MENPFGLHTVTPYLIVSDVRKLIGFLKMVFGAMQRGEIHFREDGSVKHTEMQIRNSVIMMGEPVDDLNPHQ